eukprot:4518109-Amphidinium_carterae.1
MLKNEGLQTAKNQKEIAVQVYNNSQTAEILAVIQFFADTEASVASATVLTIIINQMAIASRTI